MEYIIWVMLKVEIGQVVCSRNRDERSANRKKSTFIISF